MALSREHQKEFDARKKSVMDLLTNIGPMSRAEIQAMLKINEQNAMTVISRLKVDGQLRIVRYEHPPRNGSFIPFYGAGGGKDVNKPKPLTREQVAKRYNTTHAAVISARRYGEYHKKLGVWAGLLR